MISVLVLLITIAGMEAFSWFIHKYLFHGPLWFIHRTHHKPQHGWFEWNDVFSLVFALISMYLMWIDQQEFRNWFWIGLGITLYGLLYFVLHDGFIHKRFKTFKISNSYLLNIKRAHKIHHKSINKNSAKEFGLLITSGNYVKDPGQGN